MGVFSFVQLDIKNNIQVIHSIFFEVVALTTIYQGVRTVYSERPEQCSTLEQLVHSEQITREGRHDGIGCLRRLVRSDNPTFLVRSNDLKTYPVVYYSLAGRSRIQGQMNTRRRRPASGAPTTLCSSINTTSQCGRLSTSAPSKPFPPHANTDAKFRWR